MKHINIEIKAGCKNPEKIREILKQRNADFKGIDRQTDTYFKVPKGRLKLREGNIENNLIHYLRDDKSGPKQSDVTLFRSDKNSNLKTLLLNALEILIVVKKKREIYFIENVKFHIDEVERLGNFIEIEAIDENGEFGKEKLIRQCNRYLELFQIKSCDLLEKSYSDMLLKIGKNNRK